MIAIDEDEIEPPAAVPFARKEIARHALPELHMGRVDPRAAQVALDDRALIGIIGQGVDDAKNRPCCAVAIKPDQFLEGATRRRPDLQMPVAQIMGGQHIAQQRAFLRTAFRFQRRRACPCHATPITRYQRRYRARRPICQSPKRPYCAVIALPVLR